ncbi:hypothetical protein JCM11641_007584 [Rhodosporidiobolus odoratus]
MNEARSLLQKRYEGCRTLTPFSQAGPYGNLEDEDEIDPTREDRAIEQLCQLVGQKRWKQFGLDELLLEGWLVSLEIFALRHLTLLVEPKKKVETSGGYGEPAAKKRKLEKDSKEPDQRKSRLDSLRQAHDRAHLLRDGTVAVYGDDIDEGLNGMTRLTPFMQAEWNLAPPDYAFELFLSGEVEQAEEVVPWSWDRLEYAAETESWRVGQGDGGESHGGEGLITAVDPLLAQLRA